LLLGIIIRQWDAALYCRIAWKSCTLYLTELAKSQPILPESKLSMRGSCTSPPFIPILAICRMFSAECLSRCQEEWPLPVLCFSFTGIFTENLINSLEIWSFPCYSYWRCFCLITSMFWKQKNKKTKMLRKQLRKRNIDFIDQYE